MAKIRLTKSELKRQRENLKRFERFLPTLQLKKQQLQLEARRVRAHLSEIETEQENVRARASRWLGLLNESAAVELEQILQVDGLRVGTRNIAGLDTPVFEDLHFKQVPYDLFTTPLWYDAAMSDIRKLVELSLRLKIMREQAKLIEDELRTTTQRVNLFEKLMIPEARENIRRIQITLGDQQTSAVGRAKMAKRKAEARVRAGNPYDTK